MKSQTPTYKTTHKVSVLLTSSFMFSRVTL